MLKREIYLARIRSFYHDNLIKILIGIRRCGKSVLLEQIMEEIKAGGVRDDQLIYINFEFFEYEALTDPQNLNTYIKERLAKDKRTYIFLDEIQNVEHFEKVVNSLRAQFDVSIFITGSNSKLHANELSTILSGRYVSFNIHPLCYREVIEYTKGDPQDENVFWDYVQWGGLPNRFEYQNPEDVKKYLYSVFDSIILRDVVERLGLKNVSLFNLILQYIVDTTGREFSPQNVLAFLKHEGREVSTATLYSYVEALEKALLIQRIHRFDIHGKAILKTLNKFYMTDLGIGRIRTNHFEINKPFALENVVYNELLVRGYEVFIGKTPKGEVDFIAFRDNEPIYIQVAYLLADQRVIDREFGAFSAISDNYPKLVLSLDRTDFSHGGIKHMNLVDFLSGGALD